MDTVDFFPLYGGHHTSRGGWSVKGGWGGGGGRGEEVNIREGKEPQTNSSLSRKTASYTHIVISLIYMICVLRLQSDTDSEREGSNGSHHQLPASRFQPGFQLDHRRIV